MEQFEPREFARLVAEYAIRSSVLPPAALVMLMQDPAIDDARTAALRAQRVGAAVARAGPALPRTLRDRGAERLRPDRARRRSGRLDRSRLEGARATQARIGRPSACRVPTAGPERRWRPRRAGRSRRVGDLVVVGAAVGRGRDGRPRDSRRLAAHGRPRAHRRRGLRVDRGPGQRHDQPRRIEGLSRRGRGAAARASPPSKTRR